jgi:subtilase family serine protease
MMLKVVYPNEIESPRVRFKVTCTGMAVDLPDLTIEDISLDEYCRVVVKAKNNGPGAVFDEVWTDHKPDSTAIKLYVDGRAWGGETIWLLDPQRNLRNPGGTVVFSSNLKVSGTQEIRATIDATRQVKEKDETNNERKIALTCEAPVPEKQQ